MSQSLREQGNDAFRAGDYVKAIDLYNQATAADTTDAASPNNAAACHLKLKEFPAAKAACDVALEREPDNVKALVRRAQAYAALQKSGPAVKDYRTALKLQPNHSTASKELDVLLDARARADRKARHDPRIANWLITFESNLQKAQSGSKPNLRAERQEEKALNARTETRQLLRAFRRDFERKMGLREEDEGSDDEEEEDDDDDEEEGEGDDEDDEWETDEEEDDDAEDDESTEDTSLEHAESAPRQTKS